MKSESIRNEIAEVEWRRVTSIAWPALAAILLLQVFLAEDSFESWQFFYIIGLISTLALSWLLGRFEIIALNYFPLISYMIIAPIIIGERADNSWMSIGIITFAAAVYFGSSDKAIIALVSVTAISIFQSLISFQEISSFTDNSDLSYFNSFFSFVWIYIMGISTFYIRRRYLEVADSIQGIVESEMSESFSKLLSMKQVNQKDSRNLTLHGTILNTLIYLRNQIQLKSPTQTTVSNLKREIQELTSTIKISSSLSLEDSIRNVIDLRSRKRLEVTFACNVDNSISEAMRESCVELVRELILNSEKHTQATSASIKVIQKSTSVIEIVAIDNSTSSIAKALKTEEIAKSLESKSLKKLVTECGANLAVELISRGNLKKTSISIPLIDIQSELKTSLAKARVAGLNDFTMNFIRAGALVGFISLFGYFAVGMRPLPLAVTSVTTLLLYFALRFKNSVSILLLLTAFSASIIPTISLEAESCSDLYTIPWIFNLILVVSFFAIIQNQNRFTKWLPVVILTLESIIFPLYYPRECQNLFLGSIPGIPIIILVSLAVLAVRKREVNFDELESFEAAKMKQAFSDVDTYREAEFRKLLQDIKIFGESLPVDSLNESQLERINLEIQKIQTFLVCSEYLDSVLIRELFELVRERQSRGILGRISIFGDNFEEVSIKIDSEKLIKEIRAILGNAPANITLIKGALLEIQIEGEGLQEGRGNLEVEGVRLTFQRS